jgi:photosystem II stability/assembly factor-like uncharacterized protein
MGSVGLVVAGALLAGCMPSGAEEPTLSFHQVSAEIRAAHLFTPTSGWVLTPNRLLTTADGGTSWADVTPRVIVAAEFHRPTEVAPQSAPPPKARTLETAFFLNPTQAWAVVSGPAVTSACGLVPLDLFSSSDGGRHWSSRGMTATTQCDTPGPVYLTFVDAMRGWLIVDQGSNANFMKYDGFQTSDGGLTWTRLTYPQSAPLLFVNQLDGFSVGAGGYPQSGAYGTRDGGRTWARLALPPTAGPEMPTNFEMPVFSDDRNGVLGAEVVNPSSDIASVVFYTTSDSGRSWRLAAKVPNAERLGGGLPAGVMSGKCWLVKFFGGRVAGKSYTRLKITRDAGQTWTWLPSVVRGGLEGQVSFAKSTGWGVVVEAGCRGFKTDCYTNWSLIQTIDSGAYWTRLSVT